MNRAVKEQVTLAKSYFSEIDKAVVKLTSRKQKPLKQKHVQVLISVTWQREYSVSDIFNSISQRLAESHWVIVFKALILVHILMREGNSSRVIGYLVTTPNILNMAGFRDKSGNPLGAAQSKNIRSYALYLEEKVACYREIKDDFVRSKPEIVARFKSLPVDDKLFSEISILQRQIAALLGCTFYLEEIDNLVTLQSFRLLLGDMMALFHLVNEGVMRILASFFGLSKPLGNSSLKLYKEYCAQTTKVIEFFNIARKLSHALGMEVPVIIHAPISLATSLEEYLNAEDFESNRAAHLAKEAAKASPKLQRVSSFKETLYSVRNAQEAVQSSNSAKISSPTKLKDINKDHDFFASIDDGINLMGTTDLQMNSVSVAPAQDIQFNHQQPVSLIDPSISNFTNNITNTIPFQQLSSSNPFVSSMNTGNAWQSNFNPFQSQPQIQQQPLQQQQQISMWGGASTGNPMNSNNVFDPFATNKLATLTYPGFGNYTAGPDSMALVTAPRSGPTGSSNLGETSFFSEITNNQATTSTQAFNGEIKSIIQQSNSSYSTHRTPQPQVMSMGGINANSVTASSTLPNIFETSNIKASFPSSGLTTNLGFQQFGGGTTGVGNHNISPFSTVSSIGGNAGGGHSGISAVNTSMNFNSGVSGYGSTVSGQGNMPFNPFASGNTLNTGSGLSSGGIFTEPMRQSNNIGMTGNSSFLDPNFGGFRSNPMNAPTTSVGVGNSIQYNQRAVQGNPFAQQTQGLTMGQMQQQPFYAQQSQGTAQNRDLLF